MSETTLSAQAQTAALWLMKHTKYRLNNCTADYPSLKELGVWAVTKRENGSRMMLTGMTHQNVIDLAVREGLVCTVKSEMVEVVG